MSSLGKKIRIFCTGGWEISGTVVGEDKFTISVEKENIFLVYKNAISLIEFLPNDDSVQGSTIQNSKAQSSDPKDDYFNSSYKSGLPESMLTKPMNSDKTENLGIYFSNSESNSIVFGVKNESKSKKD
tara:strand:+ start:98 stop:481 length:384 start_codon:yes stop_codon:yes gene_type:complete